MDDTRKIFKDNFIFKEKNLSGKNKEDILEKRIV